jgi:hypothetical protein
MAEKAIQAGVSVVKPTIVVRSIINPMANLALNFLQLAMHGAGVREELEGRSLEESGLMQVQHCSCSIMRKQPFERENLRTRALPTTVNSLAVS